MGGKLFQQVCSSQEIRRHRGAPSQHRFELSHLLCQVLAVSPLGLRAPHAGGGTHNNTAFVQIIRRTIKTAGATSPNSDLKLLEHDLSNRTLLFDPSSFFIRRLLNTFQSDVSTPQQQTHHICAMSAANMTATKTTHRSVRCFRIRILGGSTLIRCAARH